MRVSADCSPRRAEAKQPRVPIRILTSADQPRARLGYAAPLRLDSAAVRSLSSRPHVSGRSTSGELEWSGLGFRCPACGKAGWRCSFRHRDRRACAARPAVVRPAAADLQDDPLVELKELSQQVEQLAATVRTAQATGQRTSSTSRALIRRTPSIWQNLDAASGRLASYQQAVDVLAGRGLHRRARRWSHAPLRLPRPRA